MKEAYILIADSSRARIFAVNSPLGDLEEIHELNHKAAHLHEKEFITDRGGRNNDGIGDRSHGLDAKISAKSQSAIQFAKQVDEFLVQAHQQGKFNKVILVAPPTFLGVLRDNMRNSLNSHVALEVNKDLVNLTPTEIRAHLPERLYSRIDAA